MSAMIIIKTRAIISRIFWNVTPYAKKRERNKRTYTRRNYIWEKRLIPLPRRHIVHPPIYTLRVSIRRPRNPFKTKEGTCRKNDGCNQLETRDVSALMRFTRPRMRGFSPRDSYAKGRCNVVVHPPEYTAAYPGVQGIRHAKWEARRWKYER